ncbi:MAG: hypothetical protein OJJ21_16950 [Ferrovibrio sp.]|uniref:hypothetical protein n=1 Tax=Ferrovibrio sp. TaxID=1917215 RepID=UPI0026051AFE|nr:hypothetical protein [Ferrovibrio sp.]MCW0235290.1 hypothetical protein [Ferrovibrio sp.]
MTDATPFRPTVIEVVKQGPAGPAIGDVRGPWAAGTYRRKSLVTHLGSLWLAQRDTSGVPGASADWLQLVAPGNPTPAAEAARDAALVAEAGAEAARSGAVVARVGAETARDVAMDARDVALEARDDAFQAIVNPGVYYDTLSELEADLAHPDGTMGVVDDDGAASGIYRKVGASGTGSWVKKSDDTIQGSADRVAAIRSDLSSTSDPEKGAGAVGFNPDETYAAGTLGDAVRGIPATPYLATGATAARSPSDRSSDWISIKDEGAVGDWDGSTGRDNSLDFDRALDRTGHIVVPPGRYYIGSKIEKVFNNAVSIRGDGRGPVELVFGDAAGGLHFDFSSETYTCDAFDLSLVSGVEGSAEALRVEYPIPATSARMPQVRIAGVQVRGDTILNDYFDNGLVFVNARSPIIEDFCYSGRWSTSAMGGKSILFSGQTINPIVNRANFVGAENGVYVEGTCEGVQVLNSQSSLMRVVVKVDKDTIGPQLVVAGCHFNADQGAVHVANMQQVYVLHNLFYGAPQGGGVVSDEYVGLLLDQSAGGTTSGITYIGNQTFQITGLGGPGTGLKTLGNVGNIHAIGNMFRGMDVGFDLSAGTTAGYVAFNTYPETTTQFTGGATSVVRMDRSDGTNFRVNFAGIDTLLLTPDQLQLTRYVANANGQNLVQRRSRGTAASPGDLTLADRVARWDHQARVNETWLQAALVESVIDSTPSGSSFDGALSFQVRNGSSLVNALALSRHGARVGPQFNNDPASGMLEGDVYWNLVSHKYRVYNGTTWADI